MTSNKTHSQILTLLKSNDYFGMSPSQVFLLRQGDVACLADNDGRFVLDTQKMIQAKPHGPWDVHHELFHSNLIEKWLEAGYKWILFFQDTKGLVFNVPKENPYYSATSGEMAIYRANSLILQKAGVKVGEPQKQVFNGEEVEVWSHIVWKPKWGMIFSDIKEKVTGNCEVSQRSTTAIRGRNVFIKDLSLDGALIVDSTDDAEVKLEGLIKNNGWTMESVDLEGTSVPVPEEIRIRGFKFNKVEQLNL